MKFKVGSKWNVEHVCLVMGRYGRHVEKLRVPCWVELSASIEIWIRHSLTHLNAFITQCKVIKKTFLALVMMHTNVSQSAANSERD